MEYKQVNGDYCIFTKQMRPEFKKLGDILADSTKERPLKPVTFEHHKSIQGISCDPLP